MKRVKFPFFLIIVLIQPFLLVIANDQNANNMASIGNGFFVENVGQWDSEVRFMAQAKGMNLWLTNRGVVFDFYRIEGNKKSFVTDSKGVEWSERVEAIKSRRHGHVVRMCLQSNCNTEPKVRKGGKSNAFHSYYKGNDPTGWFEEVPLFDEVVFENVFGINSGIDIRYYFDSDGFRYDFIVHAGVKTEAIVFSLEGVDNLLINGKSELVLTTSLGEVYHKGLYAYQVFDGKKVQVDGSFCKMEDGTIGFKVVGRDESKPIFIDPLIASTFLGGSTTDGWWGVDIAIGDAGIVYVAGETNSTNFPTTPGAYDVTYNAKQDVFVSALSSDLSQLLYSTYIGGSEDELAFGIAIGNDNKIYVTGKTESANFPTTTGSYDNTYNLGGDVYVFALDASLGSLMHSTYIGGTSTDVGYDIAIASNGIVYLTGYSGSINFPTSSGAYQGTGAGIGSVIVSALSPDLSQLLYSTYIGASPWWESGKSLAFDSFGNVYLTGETRSSNFPTTPGAYNQSFNGGDWDAFVVKFNPELTQLLHSTFIGGNQDDHGYSITLDSTNNVYLTGMTMSGNFPTTHQAYDGTFNNLRDIFVSVLNPNLSLLSFSTFLGGSASDYGYKVILDTWGNVLVAGSTGSTNFPTTTNAHSETYQGGTSDGVISVLSGNLSELYYSSFIGGSQSDEAKTLAFDDEGKLFVAGWTFSANFPTSPDAYDQEIAYFDVFISKFHCLSPEAYNLTLTANPPEGGEVIGAGSYPMGAQVEVQAIPTEEYIFINWTIEEDVVSIEESFVYTMPDSDITLVANFELVETPPFVLTLLGNPVGAGEVEGAGIYQVDELVTINAYPFEGYEFIAWTNEDFEVVSVDAEYSFNMPLGDLTLTAQFVLVDFTLTLDIVPDGAGVVFINPEQEFYNMGDTILIAAVANDGFLFLNFTDAEGEIVSELDTFTFIMPAANVNIKANFESSIQFFSVTFNVDVSDRCFDPEINTVYITGNLFDWAIPGCDSVDMVMERIEGTSIFTKNLQLQAGEYEYKYFLNDGWDGGEWVGYPNRFVYLENDYVANDVWGHSIPNVYTLFLYANPPHAGIVQDSTCVHANAFVHVSAQANQGFVFDSWAQGEDTISIEPNFIFRIHTQDESLTANFSFEGPTYTVSFSVLYPDNTQIVGAIITIDGVYKLVTDSSGASILLPNGEYEFTVNYLDFSFNSYFTVQNQDVSIEIYGLPFPIYYVTFNVTNQQQQAIEGAKIDIDGIVEDLFTDIEGNAIIQLSYGLYNYLVTAEDYQDYVGEFSALEQQAFTIYVSLIPVSDELNYFSKLNVYPNPFDNSITIENATGISRVLITNLIGQRVREVHLSDQTKVTIATGELSKGIYLVEFYATNGLRVIRKMVKK